MAIQPQFPSTFSHPRLPKQARRQLAKERLGLDWRDIGGPAAWMRPPRAENARGTRIYLGSVDDAGTSYIADLAGWCRACSLLPYPSRFANPVLGKNSIFFIFFRQTAEDAKDAKEFFTFNQTTKDPSASSGQAQRTQRKRKGLFSLVTGHISLAPRSTKRSNYNNSINASTVSPASLMMCWRVDRFTGLWAGTVILMVPSGTCFSRRIWLPFWRITSKPARSKAERISR